MSGHSKWHGIKHKKALVDAKKGKIFTKHARLIEIAAREGGNGDPSTNTRLKMAIDSAKAENVPNDNIDRAIKKGTGELKGEQMAEVLYAAYGPGGAAFLIECLTDNRNRTLSNVKNIIGKSGGNWAEVGSVQWMFERKGVVTARKEGTSDLGEELELALIDAGADAIEGGETVTVTSDVGSWTHIRDVLKGKGYQVLEAGMKYMPKQTAAITDKETAQEVMSFVEAIEEEEDVSEVHTNADVSEEIAYAL